jgi:hypothetical protein
MEQMYFTDDVDDDDPRSSKILRAITSLTRLMAYGPLDGEIPRLSITDINISPSITFDSDTLDSVIDKVVRFNALPSNERNASIDDPTSVHNLMRDILSIVRGTNSVGEKRICYEWPIQHPVEKNSNQFLDFLFIGNHQSHPNWYDYAGGLECKLAPQAQDGSGSANIVTPGSMATGGMKQSMKRAAMCVYARWRACRWTRTHVAYCCFADSRRFGLSRVQIDDNATVSKHVYGPIDLPGFNGCVDPTALRVLKHLLVSPSEELTDLMSLPMQIPMSRELTGWVTSETGTVTSSTWTLGSYIGAGGFATVYADDANPTENVIKVAICQEHYSKVTNEHRILSLLAKTVTDSNLHFPRVVDALAFFPPENLKVTALKLSPRGVTVKQYLSAVDYDRAAVQRVICSMGAAMVRALQSAHSAYVAHADVRATNILVIPPNNIMAGISSALGDFEREKEAIRAIEIDDCLFILNDWGEGVTLRTLDALSREARAKEDLRLLVRTLECLCGTPDPLNFGRDPISGKKGCPVPLIAMEGRPQLKEDAASELLNLANSRNYEGLAQFFLDADDILA